MKIIVEFELNDSFEACYADNEQRLNSLLKPNLDGVKTTIVKNLNLHNVSFSSIVIKKWKEYRSLTDSQDVYKFKYWLENSD